MDMTAPLLKKLHTAEASVQGAATATAIPLTVSWTSISAPPAELGGTSVGTNPEQLFALGYGASFQSATGVVGRRMGVDTSESRVTSRVSWGTIEGGLRPRRRSPRFSSRRRAEGGREAGPCRPRGVPLQNATRGNIEVELKVV
jgi:lipoyl-dependent peroxiredoxin